MLASHRSLIAALLPVVLAAVGITPARAQSRPEANPIAPQDPYESDDADDADDAAPVDNAAPPAEQPAPPAEQPPAPPASPPPVQVQPGAPVPQMQPAPQASSGQWVYTQQYGWLWMPYGDQYVSSPENPYGTVYPYEYVYRPAYGWTWLTAPWVWGWGPEIYFGLGGPRYYNWFHHRGFVGHGVFRGPGFRGELRGPVRGYGGHGSGGHGSVGHFGGHGSVGHFGGHGSVGHFGGHFGGHGSHR